MDADLVKKALKVRHPADRWIYATEVRSATAFRRPHNNGLGGIRVIDAFAISLWPSDDYRRVAYEIKVHRSDWLSELAEPTKRAQAYFLSDKFYYVVVPGMWTLEDLPRDAQDCGLIEVQETGAVKNIRPCLKGPALPMPIWFIASLLRRVRDCDWREYTRFDIEALFADDLEATDA
jgi:hypothetical protein